MVYYPYFTKYIYIYIYMYIFWHFSFIVHILPNIITYTYMYIFWQFLVHINPSPGYYHPITQKLWIWANCTVPYISAPNKQHIEIRISFVIYWKHWHEWSSFISKAVSLSFLSSSCTVFTLSQSRTYTLRDLQPKCTWDRCL